MMKNVFLLTRKNVPLVLLFVMSGVAWAAGVVSPPLYVKDGPAGGTATCRVFQFSSVAGEPVTQTNIYANNSTAPLPLTSNSCNQTAGLKQNENCSFGAAITGNLSYTCVFTSDGSAGASYTGTIEIQDSQFNVLAREPMRSQ